MPVEAVLFLIATAIFMGLTLLWLSRSKPGNALSLMGLAAPLSFGLALWLARIAFIHRGSEVAEGGLVALAVAFGVAYFFIDRRLRVEERLIFPRADMPVFQESFASGRGCDSFLMRLGGARRCLLITVTEDELWIRPVGPLVAFARLWGLLHRVPLTHVHQMERLVGKRANIRLEYSGADGWCRCVELLLRNPTAFVEAVREGQFQEAA